MEIHYAIGGAGEPVFLLHGPHYADPISCPVLAVGAQCYLGDEVSKQLAQVARNGVRQFLDIGAGLPTANNTRWTDTPRLAGAVRFAAWGQSAASGGQ